MYGNDHQMKGQSQLVGTNNGSWTVFNDSPADMTGYDDMNGAR